MRRDTKGQGRSNDRVPPRGRLSAALFYFFQFHIIHEIKENSTRAFSSCSLSQTSLISLPCLI
nr:MAG TPA: hypothetical protein [Caudoviricetes sp.]